MHVHACNPISCMELLQDGCWRIKIYHNTEYYANYFFYILLDRLNFEARTHPLRFFLNFEYKYNKNESNFTSTISCYRCHD